jgi:hypothetical protein
LEKFSLGSGVNVQRYIDSAVTDMTVAIAKQKKHIKSQQNEEVAADRSKAKEKQQIAAKRSKHSKSKN